jgi:hypothetical protein
VNSIVVTVLFPDADFFGRQIDPLQRMRAHNILLEYSWESEVRCAAAIRILQHVLVLWEENQFPRKNQATRAPQGENKDAHGGH